MRLWRGMAAACVAAALFAVAAPPGPVLAAETDIGAVGSHKTDTKTDSGDEKKQDASDTSSAGKPRDGGKPTTDNDQNEPDKKPKKPGEDAGDESDDIWSRKTLLGDIGPLRPFLAA